MLSLFILSSELLNSRSLWQLHFFARVEFRNRSKDQFKSNSLKFFSEAIGGAQTHAFSSSYHYRIEHTVSSRSFCQPYNPLNPSKNLIELNLPVLRSLYLTCIPP